LIDVNRHREGRRCRPRSLVTLGHIDGKLRARSAVHGHHSDAFPGWAASVPALAQARSWRRTGLQWNSRGDLDVGEVSWTVWPQTFKDKPRPDNLRPLHKFRKVDSGVT
jgi:hypothetical protein